MAQLIDLKSIYDLQPPLFQAWIDRMRYSTGLLPRVNLKPSLNSGGWLPDGKRAALVISADFELGWAWRYMRGLPNPLDIARKAARQTRLNLPTLLKKFDRYAIPITWATVGHLFLDHCERHDNKAHSDLPRPDYFENEYWGFGTGDWYDADPCSNLVEDPEWYASDLIQAILDTKVKHEIGCHTFSHIDCSENVCSPELLRAEIIASQELARGWGIDLKSFVFPGNLSGNLPILKENGFESYRLHSRYHLGIPTLDENGLYAFPGGIQWEMPDGWKAKDWMKAIRLCLDKALETNTLLHLWFHPSCEKINVEAIFPDLLEYIKIRQSEIWVVTMGELVDYLKKRNDEQNFFHKD